MESIKNNRILKFQPNPVETLRKKYNMDNGRMEESLDLLEDWIRKQSHFRCHEFDREYLERSIICCKGSLEKTKKQTDRLCTLRTLVPKFFIYGDIRNEFKELMEIACIVISQKQTTDFKRVLTVKVSDKDFTSKTFLDFYRFMIVMCEYMKLRDFTDGYLAVIDLRDVNLLEVIKKFNPVDVQQILTVMIEGYGAVIKGIHLMSHSKVIDILIKTVKPLLSPKIAERIFVHEENEELFSIIDRELLNAEYGGKGGSIYDLNDLWFDEFCSPKFEAYLATQELMGTNESLRLTEKFNEDCIGLPGSFRSMSVD